MTLYVPAKAGVEHGAPSGSKSPRSDCRSCSWTTLRRCSGSRMTARKSGRSGGRCRSHSQIRWSGVYWHRTTQAGNGLICSRRNTLKQNIIMPLYVPATAGVERSARPARKSPRSEFRPCSWTSPRGCTRPRMSVCKSRRSRGRPCSHPPLRWSGVYWHRTAQAGNGLIC